MARRAGRDLGCVLAGAHSDTGEVGGERRRRAGDTVRNISGQVENNASVGYVAEPQLRDNRVGPFIQGVHVHLLPRSMLAGCREPDYAAVAAGKPRLRRVQAGDAAWPDEAPTHPGPMPRPRGGGPAARAG